MEAINESSSEKKHEPMEALDDIFSEFTDLEPEIHRLLGFLKKRLPEGKFCFVTGEDILITSEDAPKVSQSKLTQLVKGASDKSTAASVKLAGGTIGYGLTVDAYKGTLISIVPKALETSSPHSGPLALIQLSIELFFSHNSLHEKEDLFIIQKKQLHRQLQVLEKRYQEILEDNHRGYQIIREQQENYSRMLKSEIDRQTAELRNANNELEEKRQFQQKILDTAATAIYTTDPHRRITDVNEEFCNITGYQKEEVIGHNIDILQFNPSDDLNELVSSDPEKRILKKQCSIRTKGGRELIIMKSADFMFNESASVIGAVESFSDVTDLIKARENAEAANKAKSVFLASMSHEIRTPMNSVIGFTDMLLDTGLKDEQVDYAETIKRSGDALLSLINDILDFSKVEAGQMDLETIDFDPEITAFDVCESIRTRVAKNPIEILCRIGINVPAYLKGDPGRFRQVLINLMGNAAKFTEAGEIELFLDVAADTHDRIKLHVMVRDTGIGIAKNKLDSIFEAFQQEDNSTTRKYGGTGLGLSICQKIAAIMDGEVWAESPAPLDNRIETPPEAGPGSVFHFTCWLEKSDTKPQDRISKVSLEDKRVLVVDDNQANLDIMKHMLEMVGMRTVCVLDGAEAIPALKEAAESEEPFSMCILDILLGDMNGVDIAKEIRNLDTSLSKIPLLAFSSSMDQTAKSCREVGFDGFLPKPIRKDRLYKMLEELLSDKAEDEDKATEPSQKGIVTQHSLREKAKHSIQILLAEDNVLNQKLAVVMLKSAGYQVEVAKNGKEAIDKYTASPDRFDLIFMDIQMPDVDGLSATKVIREAETKTLDIQRPVPIIAMTANAMKGDREKCLDAGMDDYMAKPIKRETVFEMVDNWVLKQVPGRSKKKL